MIAKIKGTYQLKSVGGLYKQNPLLAILFIVPAFALAGVPPLSGFFAKFMLIKAGFENGNYIITIVALLTGLLTLYSMIKIWNEAFLKKQPENIQHNEGATLSWLDYVPLALLAIALVLMGVCAATLFSYTYEAANQLIDPTNYIESVLNNKQL